MKRRDFLQKGIGAGILAGTSLSMFKFSKLFGSTLPVNNPPDETFDLVAVRDGEPVPMFERGIESLGGMRSFVKPGQTVVVKPNIGWDAPPERAANTNPALVKRIIEQCFEAGAKEVYVFDNTCDNWQKCYETSGIEQAVKEAGGKMVPGNTENYYRPVEIPMGKKLKNAKVHELILDSDVFINVPILKNHGSTRLTIAMKNLMGVVWDRRYWHSNALNQCIADYTTFHRKPDLNIVDAWAVMKRNGPRGVSESDVVMLKSLLISTDIVAVDTAATKLYGLDPSQVSYLGLAEELGVGTTDLTKLKIDRIKM